MTTQLRSYGLAPLLLTLLLSGSVAPDASVADAAMRGDVTEVRSLLRSGADVNAAQGDGMTALHWAAERGNAEVAELLISASADVEAKTRIGSYTPLHLGSRGGHVPTIMMLLEAGGDPDAVTTNSGVTPLHLAASAIGGRRRWRRSWVTGRTPMCARGRRVRPL